VKNRLTCYHWCNRYATGFILINRMFYIYFYKNMEMIFGARNNRNFTFVGNATLTTQQLLRKASSTKNITPFNGRQKDFNESSAGEKQ